MEHKNKLEPVFKKKTIEVEVPYCPSCGCKMEYYKMNRVLKAHYDCSDKKCKVIIFVD